MRNFIIFLILLLSASVANSGGVKKGEFAILDMPDHRAMIHSESNIRFTITNYGTLGSFASNINCGVEFPAGSSIEHLFLGALWIGAKVDTVDSEGNPTSDTLVSIGQEGWWAGISELNPTPGDNNSLWEDNIFGDQEFFAVFNDTLTDPNYILPDPFDGRPHIPLGLKITQNSFCWASPDYYETFIIEFNLENIGGRNLHDVWIGIYYDGDVWHSSEMPYAPDQGGQDDLCGFIEHDDLEIAWLADNDGQPHNGAYDYTSSTGLMALALLGASQSDLQTNFNWWISEIFSEYDWGPQWQSNFDIWGPFPGGGRGTPGGDKAKYQIMSNGEHDYDQIWTALDHTGDGWIPGVVYGDDIAKGYETRYLISFGPLQITAGAVETLTVAFFGGNGFHSDPENYSQNLQIHPYDSIYIAQYYANLDFTDLLAKADSAKSYYQRGYTYIPHGPPHAFAIAGWGEDHTELRWNSVARQHFSDYRVYRGTEPGIYDSDPVTPENYRDTVFIDAGLENNTIYYYVVRSFNDFGVEGGSSPELMVNSGQPQTPVGLIAHGGNSLVDLSWNDNPDTDIHGYLIYMSERDEPFMVIDTASTADYTHYGVVNGFSYRYFIQAIDDYGNLSFISDTVQTLPMALDSGILLINDNRTNYNPDYDSMIVFYQNAFSGYQNLIVFEEPRYLFEITSFSTIIWLRDFILGRNSFDYLDSRNLYSIYLEAGGNLILAGTRQIVPASGFEGTLMFQPGQFPYNYLNLAGIDYPHYTFNDFIGGEHEREPFSDFQLDSARIDRIVFPGEANGRLFGIGTLIPNDSSEVIYNYISPDPDSSHFHGKPIGIVHQTESYNTALLEFPLYYAEEPTSFQIIHRILDEFGETRVDIVDPESSLPVRTELSQNYPNPFNAETVLKYRLAESGIIDISIYNILGARVTALINEEKPAGEYTLIWRAGNLPSGIYFARLVTPSESKHVKMVMLK